jgi:glycosyltransferase involved in cell wall biosynthesis
MVATQTLADDLASRGFKRPMLWPRGVDEQLFRPVDALPAELTSLPRPFFLYCGRVAPEKNIEAFLELDLPGSKIVVGDGPSRAQLQEKFPGACFVGVKSRGELAPYYSAADVFVFPSRTDTFGNVMLEALACGAPVAAFPVPGPLDIVTDPRIGVLDEDLRAACLGALSLSRESCRDHALRYTWPESARMFIDNVLLARRAALSRRVSA